MQGIPISRDAAIALLRSSAPEQSDMNHYLESEAVMRAVARYLEEPEDYWAMLGLLHDIDWSETKHDSSLHLTKAPELLKKAGFDQEFIDVILSHGFGFDCADLKDKRRQRPIEHALAASETVTGLIHSYALMRKTIDGMDVQGLRKKLKDKKFAAGVDRSIIQECELIPIPLDIFLDLAIKAIQSIKGEVGL